MHIKKYRLSLAILAGALSSTVLISAGNAFGWVARSSFSDKVFATVFKQFSSRSVIEGAGSKTNANANSDLDFSGADVGKPEQTTGAGSRGCSQKVEKPLVPLMPATEDPNPSGYNPSKLLFYITQKTASVTPSLFFYVPKYTTVDTGELAIIDGEGNEIYLSSFALGDNPGVIKLSLPKNISLEIGREYEWEFALVCNPDDRSADYYLQGKIQITELSPDLRHQLELETEAIAKAKLFAKARIWHDTLELAAQARQQKPKAWTDLLASVGLKDFADEPIIECCSLEN
ncbi:MAG: DUF928 domain-containing protein [Oscillatoria sp. SIO1A7]|nr:DUF928 domain-containing protein [Oscillatoria sp. SIO1A7]